MMVTSKISVLISVFIFLIVSSCKEEGPSPGMGTVTLTFASDGDGSISAGRIVAGSIDGAVVITDFQISIRDVIFKSDMDDSNMSDDTTEVDFRGPFAIDLMNESEALSQTIGEAEVPVGEYHEVRFKFHKTRDVAENHPLYDRSIYVKGTVDGEPFEMWHDTSENLDIGRSTGFLVDENGVNIKVVFTIDQFLNSYTAIELSDALDNDGDGVIEINPDDDDDNGKIADDLKENIKAAADILDEM